MSGIAGPGAPAAAAAARGGAASSAPLAVAPPRTRPVLLFDLDGIVANLVKKWLAHYNRDYGDNLTEADVTSWDWDTIVKRRCGKRIFHYLSRPGFFADLEPLPGAIESIASFQDRAELVVVTASPRVAMSDKVAWVRKHLPFVHKDNIVITRRKDLVRGDFMFDDAPRNLERFPGIRIMLDYPYNRDFHDCHRVRDFDEFRELMDRLLRERGF